MLSKYVILHFDSSVLRHYVASFRAVDGLHAALSRVAEEEMAEAAPGKDEAIENV